MTLPMSSLPKRPSTGFCGKRRADKANSTDPISCATGWRRSSGKKMSRLVGSMHLICGFY